MSYQDCCLGSRCISRLHFNLQLCGVNLRKERGVSSSARVSARHSATTLGTHYSEIQNYSKSESCTIDREAATPAVAADTEGCLTPGASGPAAARPAAPPHAIQASVQGALLLPPQGSSCLPSPTPAFSLLLPSVPSPHAGPALGSNRCLVERRPIACGLPCSPTQNS